MDRHLDFVRARLRDCSCALLLSAALAGCTSISTAQISSQGLACTHSTDIRGDELAAVIGGIGAAAANVNALTAESSAPDFSHCFCEANAGGAKAGCGDYGD